MRDQIGLAAHEVALVVAGLEKLERLAAAGGGGICRELALLKLDLSSWLASRVDGRVDATTRPAAAPVVHAASGEFIDTQEVAEMLGIAVDSARKACRTGRWRGIALKVHGRWMLPVEEVEGRGGAA